MNGDHKVQIVGTVCGRSVTFHFSGQTVSICHIIKEMTILFFFNFCLDNILLHLIYWKFVFNPCWSLHLIFRTAGKHICHWWRFHKLFDEVIVLCILEFCENFSRKLLILQDALALSIVFPHFCILWVFTCDASADLSTYWYFIFQGKRTLLKYVDKSALALHFWTENLEMQKFWKSLKSQNILLN